MRMRVPQGMLRVIRHAQCHWVTLGDLKVTIEEHKVNDARGGCLVVVVYESVGLSRAIM